jgi:hypothetical protein
VGNVTRQWIGLKNTSLQSLIAYYVYYHFVKDQANSYESIGAVISEGENSTRTSPDYLMIQAWNKYVDLHRVACEFLLVNFSQYPIWIYTEAEKNNTFGI